MRRKMRREKWGSQAREVFVQLSLVAPRKTLHWLEESIEPVVEKFEKATDESLEAGDNTPLEELTKQLFDLWKKAGPVLRAESSSFVPEGGRSRSTDIDNVATGTPYRPLTGRVNPPPPRSRSSCGRLRG